MVCGEIKSLIQIVSRTASAEVESDVQVQGTASDRTVHRSLSQSGLSGRWLRRASWRRHITKSQTGIHQKVNTAISQELSELSMFPYPEQLLNSFKYNGFIFHLFTLPKIPGLRSCVYPWTPERMYELLWRGRWETLVPTMPKSCRVLLEPPGLPEHLSRASTDGLPAELHYCSQSCDRNPNQELRAIWVHTFKWSNISVFIIFFVCLFVCLK